MAADFSCFYSLGCGGVGGWEKEKQKWSNLTTLKNRGRKN